MTCSSGYKFGSLSSIASLDERGTRTGAHETSWLHANLSKARTYMGCILPTSVCLERTGIMSLPSWYNFATRLMTKQL
jgi:hypothetical protein